ncbi:MAG: hypothetical protein AB7H71_00380 [Alphaproteobacteria bacterium]
MAVYHTRSSTWNGSAAVGPLTEGAAGIAVIVLTILALAAVSPGILTAIATIVVGVGLFIEATNTGIEYSRAGSAAQSGAEIGQLGADVSVEVLAGIVGVVLGVLALIGAATAMSLLPAALIVFGGALILAGMSATRIGRISETEAGTSVAWGSELAPSRGVQVLIGVAAVVLGILAYVLPTGGVLLVVGLLAVGTALLATSANFTRSFMSMFAA